MKTIFIYNPESGRGKVKKNLDYIITTLAPKFGEIEVFETHAPHDATRIAAENGSNCDYILLAGGDGTLNEVVTGVMSLEKRPTIGYLPSGTVNDVAHSLGIPRKLKAAARALLRGVEKPHDIFKVNDHYGIYVCCAGLFTTNSYLTARSAKKRLGKTAYFLNGVKDVFSARPIDVTLTANGEKFSFPCAMMLIINSRSVAGFLLNKNANLNDGVVDVVLVRSSEKRVRLAQVLRCMNMFVCGLKHKSTKNVTFLQASSLEVETSATINIDGERGFDGSFSLEVLKGAINIITIK